MKKILFAVALATFSLATHADTISGLHNTGQGLAAGVADVNYKVTDTTGATSTPYVAANVYPIGAWMANTAASQWLLLTTNSPNDQPQGFSVWTSTFDLSGFDAASASFSGRFSADDAALVMLNNNRIGTSAGYSSWSNFSAQAGSFVAGVNTLEFVVFNQGGSAGLRAEFIATEVSAVPESETYAMLLAGLGLMGFLARRRKA